MIRARIPKAIAAKISKAENSVNINAIITKAINTIAETRIGLAIIFCKAIEKSTTAIGITTKNKITVKISIQKHNLSKDKI